MEVKKIMGFEEMEPIFGELKAEWPGLPEMARLRPFLFLVHALPTEPSTLSIQVTDFHSNTWEALKSRSQLEDMRDSTGIGGSWSDFVEYFVSSIKSEDIKLVMEGQSTSGGAACAKLIAQKAKGMPRIVISLAKLVDAAANDAVSNLSLELYEAYRNVHNSLIKDADFRTIVMSSAYVVAYIVNYVNDIVQKDTPPVPKLVPNVGHIYHFQVELELRE